MARRVRIFCALLLASTATFLPATLAEADVVCGSTWDEATKSEVQLFLRQVAPPPSLSFFASSYVPKTQEFWACIKPDISECPRTPCVNGGTCEYGVENNTCYCLPGFTGAYCEIDIDECQSEPCLNQGRCVDGADGYNCTCLQWFAGKHCEKREIFRTVACEQHVLELDCGTAAIHIVDARYGRPTGETVCGHPEVSGADCHASNSLSVVKAACEGRTACSMLTSSDNFEPSCQATHNYLKVLHECLCSVHTTTRGDGWTEGWTTALRMAAGNERVEFFLRSARDAIVYLTPLDSSYVGAIDIILCASGNVLSMIRSPSCNQCATATALTTFCCPSEYVGLWISFAGGLIRVGMVGESTPTLEWQETDAYPIGSIGVHSLLRSNADWMFSAPCVWE